jgi:hypothetical protein
MPLINFPLLGEEGKISLFHHLGTALSAAARLSRRSAVEHKTRTFSICAMFTVYLNSTHLLS